MSNAGARTPFARSEGSGGTSLTTRIVLSLQLMTIELRVCCQLGPGTQRSSCRALLSLVIKGKVFDGRTYVFGMKMLLNLNACP